MPRGKRIKAEEIVSKLRQAEVMLAKGTALALVCKQLEISPQSYYRWRKECGGLEIDQAKKFKDLERENARLKKLVADMALDNAMLTDIASGNF